MTWADTTPFPGNPIYPRRLDEMAREGKGYNPTILQVPTLFDNTGDAFPELPADALVVGNGNHRRALAEREGRLDHEFIALIHRDCTAAEVYEIRSGVNVQRTVKPAERFLNLAARGDREACEIIAVIEGLGWSVTHERSFGGLSCTKELQWLWREQGGRGAVVGAVRSYEEIWGRRDANAQGRAIKGLGAFWLRYPEAEMERLVVTMRRSRVSVNELYEAGKFAMRELPPIKSTWEGIRWTLATTYNRGLRKGVLPLP